MYKPWRIIIVLIAFLAAVVTVSSLYADNIYDRSGTMMGRVGIMSHMGSKHDMMEGCFRIMGIQGGHSGKPNDQWRK